MISPSSSIDPNRKNRWVPGLREKKWLRSYQWVSGRKTQLQCVSIGVTSFLHWPIDIQCSATITQSILFKILIIDTPQARYRVSVMSLKSDLRPAAVVAVPWVITWLIGPRYNGTRLYFEQNIASLGPKALLCFDNVIRRFVASETW